MKTNFWLGLISGLLVGYLFRPAVAKAQAPNTLPAGTSVSVSLDSVEMAGVVFSDDDRQFLTLPRVGVNHPWPAIVEMVNGKPVAFPSPALTLPSSKPYVDWIVSPLGLTIHKRTLWVLDEGKRAGIDGIPEGAAKLMAIDIDSRKLLKTIVFKAPFFNPTIQLNDLQFDPTHGKEGTIYIANNGYAKPDNSLIVVDVATERMRELFHNQPETSPAPGFMTYVEGKPHAYSTDKATMPQGGVNGIVLSPDSKRLYWTIPTNPNYYSIATDALSDFAQDETVLKLKIRFEGQTASNGGITIDEKGRIYFGDASRYAITRKDPSGSFSLVAYDPRLIWPDGLAYHKGYLYVSIGQWQRAPNLNGGKDLRKGPYQVLRIPIAP